MNMQINTTCGSCNKTIDDCCCNQKSVCDQPIEYILDPNSSYAVALKKVLTPAGCSPSVTCGGYTMPLENFIQQAVFGLFSPVLTVNKVDHGLNMDFGPVAVYQDQSNPGEWLKALDTVNQAEALVIEIIDNDNFKIASASGFYKFDHGLDPILTYYLSATIPGRIDGIVSTQKIANPVTTETLQYYGPISL